MCSPDQGRCQEGDGPKEEEEEEDEEEEEEEGEEEQEDEEGGIEVNFKLTKGKSQEAELARCVKHD